MLQHGVLHGELIAQALEARRQGKALPLKDFHNAIKRKMINRWGCIQSSSFRADICDVCC